MSYSGAIPVAPAAAEASARALDERRNAITVSLRRPKVRRRRLSWPVFLCGFVAGLFGSIALLKSPLGGAPPVRRVVTTLQSRAANAYAGAKRLVHR
jgi:hypothetical protein